MSWGKFPAWLKGGVLGLALFVLFFITLSLANTGKISIGDAFGFKDPASIFNYVLVLIFVVVGAIIGVIVEKIKSKNRAS